MITYRRELHLVCDAEWKKGKKEYGCVADLMLDQLDGGHRANARTLKSIAVNRHHWEIDGPKCYCPKHRLAERTKWPDDPR